MSEEEEKGPNKRGNIESDLLADLIGESSLGESYFFQALNNMQPKNIGNQPAQGENTLGLTNANSSHLTQYKEDTNAHSDRIFIDEIQSRSNSDNQNRKDISNEFLNLQDQDSDSDPEKIESAEVLEARLQALCKYKDPRIPNYELEQYIKQRSLRLLELKRKDSELSRKSSRLSLARSLQKELSLNKAGHSQPINLKRPTHVGLMFSFPLVQAFRYVGSRATIMNPLNSGIRYPTELETLKNSLEKLETEINIQVFPARGFTEFSTFRPNALHFCGEAIEKNFPHKPNEKYHLLLEGTDCSAKYMSSEDLIGIFSFTNEEKALYGSKEEDSHDGSLKCPDFIFAASSKSSFMGDIFLKAGANHVICRQNDFEIPDKTLLEFIKVFYHAYFSGKYKVCEAFELTQKRLEKSNFEGATHFKILTKDENHYCRTKFVNLQPGSVCNLSPVPKYEIIPMQHNRFFGRKPEMYEVINLILAQRFVTITGAPGIGKSALAIEIAKYLYARNIFEDGVVFVSLQNIETVDAIITLMISTFNREVIQEYYGQEEQKNYFQSICRQLFAKEGKLLLVFDDADQTLHACRFDFSNFIHSMLSEAKDLKVLLTSRISVEGMPDYSGKKLCLSHLDKESSQEFLIDQAPRGIDENEIAELLSYQPTQKELDAFDALHLSKSDNEKHDGGNVADRDASQEKKKALQNHMLMKILSGHPLSIKFASALLGTKVEPGEENNKYLSLKELFRWLLTKPLAKVLGDQNLSNKERNSFNSLQVSLDLSIRHLEKRENEALRFFGLIGLLPAGINEKEITGIWEDEWEELATTLMRYSLLLKLEKRPPNGQRWYSLYPFMTSYAEGRMEIKDREYFSQQIRKNLIKKAETFFKQLITKEAVDQPSLELFLLEEPNFKASISRVLRSHVLKDQSTEFSLRNFQAMSNSQLYSSQTRPEVFDAQSNESAAVDHFKNLNKQNHSEPHTEQHHSSQLEESKKAQLDILQVVHSNSGVNLESDEGKIKSGSKVEILGETSNLSNNISESLSQKNESMKSEISKSTGLNSTKKLLVLRAEYHLMLLYCSILFLLAREKECKRLINYGIMLHQTPLKDELAIANFEKLEACLCLQNKNVKESARLFVQSLKSFKKLGCLLGIAICEFGLGYLKVNYLDQIERGAKYLLRSLTGFRELNHNKGKYIAQTWLAYVAKNQNLQDISLSFLEQAQEVLGTDNISDPSNYDLKEEAFLLEIVLKTK